MFQRCFARLTVMRHLLLGVVYVCCVGRSEQYPTGRTQECHSYKLYYDHGTEMCERCSEICLDADLIGTVEQCQTNCPNYLEARECEERENWFYDELLNDCKPCCQLCSDPLFQPECARKCAAYLSKKTASEGSTRGPSLQTEDLAKARAPCSLGSAGGGPGTDSGNGSDETGLPLGSLIVMVLGGLATLCALGMLALLCRTMRSSKAYTPVSQGATPVSQGATPVPQGAHATQAETRDDPVEETRRSPTLQQYVVADGGIGQQSMRVKTAFSDLRHDVIRGDSV